ncbi:MAG: hypothetical protein ACLFV7_15025 [Phycisphaerae bacterium]
MRTTILTFGLLSLVLLGGCGQKKYAMEVNDARDSLERNFPEQAEVRLARARQIAEEYDLDESPEATLLAAEARIQLDDLATAGQLAQSVADTNVPGTRVRAQAEEVLAKVAIRRGDFRSAITHLAQADRSYTAPAERRRIADLIHLVDGLRAYGRGKTALADEHWGAISDAKLRVAIEANRSH